MVQVEECELGLLHLDRNYGHHPDGPHTGPESDSPDCGSSSPMPRRRCADGLETPTDTARDGPRQCVRSGHDQASQGFGADKSSDRPKAMCWRPGSGRSRG
jgi:hypothetical protein